MLITDFIKTHENWRELLQEKPYCLTVKEEDGYILLKYSQIESDFNNPLVRECRGIILDSNYKPVCVPFYKFGNYGESYCPDIDWESARVQEKVDGCFSGEDCVLLADGSKRSIKTIVKNKQNVDVLSYNFITGKIEPKRVIGWSVSSQSYPLSDWLTIKLKNVEQSLKCSKTSQHCIITPTRNHMFFRKTQNGFEEVIANELKVGDIIFTPIQDLTFIEKQVCLGTLLGDGSCTYVRKSSHKGIRFCHSYKQYEYCKYKADFLSNIGGKLTVFRTDNSFGKEKVRFTSKTNPAIDEIYDDLYSSTGKKIVTEKYLEQLDWLGFAIWYMDDGSLDTGNKNNSINLHTEGFSYEEVNTISNFYNNKGYKNYIQKYRNYYKINFSTRASELIWQKIREYIIPTMAYKLPERHRGFFNRLVDTEKRQIRLGSGYIQNIQKGLKCHNPYKSKKVYRYDIEVEDNHNYFCQGVLVHNSLIKLWYDKGWKVSTNGTINAYKSDMTQSAFSALNIIPYKTFGNLFDAAKKMCGLRLNKLNKSYTYMFELVSPYNKVVIPYDKIKIYHIGTRDNKTLQELDIDIGIEKPKQFNLHTLEECLEATRKMPFNEEGYVVVDKNWNRVKIKSPAYVAVHRIKNNGELNLCSLIQLIRENETSEFRIYFPEYSEYLDKLQEKIDGVIKNLEKELDVIKDKTFETQKDFALAVKDKPFSAFYFLWNKDKTLTPKAWFWGYDNNKIKEMLKCQF